MSSTRSTAATPSACGPSSRFRRTVHRLGDAPRAVATLPQRIEERLLGFGELPNRFFQGQMAIFYANHDLHPRFHQFAGRLQPEIELFHALFGALHALFGALHALFGAFHAQFSALHALIEPDFHLVPALGHRVQQRLNALKSFAYLAFHSRSISAGWCSSYSGVVIAAVAQVQTFAGEGGSRIDR